VTLHPSERTRKLLGLIGALIFVVFFGSVLDSCVARFREPLFTVHLLPGGSDLVEGQVDHGLKDLSLLRVETSNESVRLTIDRFQAGFWLGGNMWVGTISVAADAAPGTYDLRVFDVNQPPAKPVAAFQAVVYPDDAALRQSSFSFVRRTFDVAPGMVALACIPGLGLVMGLAYLLGRRVDQLLARQGKAEVFLVKKAPAGMEIYFGLGRRHGVEPGMRVSIHSGNGQSICGAVVQQVDAENAMALASSLAERLPRGAVVVLPGGR
jgi:hypothetical protein